MEPEQERELCRACDIIREQLSRLSAILNLTSTLPCYVAIIYPDFTVVNSDQTINIKKKKDKRGKRIHKRQKIGIKPERIMSNLPLEMKVESEWERASQPEVSEKWSIMYHFQCSFSASSEEEPNDSLVKKKKKKNEPALSDKSCSKNPIFFFFKLTQYKLAHQHQWGSVVLVLSFTHTGGNFS